MKTNHYSIPSNCCKLLVVMTLCTVPAFSAPATALESGLASLVAPKGDFYLELDPNEHRSEQKEVQEFLDNIEQQWNAHNLEGLMSNYADDYVNNDGLNKKAVNDLTKDFWDQYPDAKSASKTKEVRIEGNYATVDSRDVASGNTAKEIPGVNSKGQLRSVSEGQLYLRKFANGWKIIGDRINYEKVKVAYGLARQIDSTFVAPEQVKAGRKYSAKLEVKLPTGLIAVGEITTQNLQYPSAQSIFPNSAAPEVWKPLDTNALEKDSYILERIMEANSSNHNELIMTTLGITNAQRNSLVGLEFLTRRMNVVPATTDEPETEVAEESAKKDVKAAKIDDADTKKNSTSADDSKAKTPTPSSQPQSNSPKTPNKKKSHTKSST